MDQTKISLTIRRLLLASVIAALGGLLIPVPDVSSQDAPGVSAARFARLARGINLAGWFWYGPRALNDIEEYFTDTDFELIRAMGFTHVRVPINLEFLLDENSADLLDHMHLPYFDRALARILAHDLAVIVDIHSTSLKDASSSVYSGRLEDDPAFVDTFEAFWRAFAAHLSTTDPEMVFLEAMNEPVFEADPSLWPPMQTRLLAAIREGAPDHTLIATSARWSHIDTFVQLEPLDDPNVVYNFHFYEPFVFTHQGADWTWWVVASLKQVPYPSSPEAVEPAIKLVHNDEVETALRQYGAERWDAAKLENLIGRAVAWGEQYNVRLTCNEFGVYSPVVFPQHRAQWLRDVVTIFEDHHVGWTMWEYDGGFGLVKRWGSRTKIDETIVEALGLQVPATPDDE